MKVSNIRSKKEFYKTLNKLDRMGLVEIPLDGEGEPLIDLTEGGKIVARRVRREFEEKFGVNSFESSSKSR